MHQVKVRKAPNKKHRAVCSCGWTGPVRDVPRQTVPDGKAHIDFIQANRPKEKPAIVAVSVTATRARIQQLSTTRARLLENQRKLEWTFTNNPSVQTLDQLRSIRSELSAKEAELISLSAIAKAEDIMASSQGAFTD